MNTSTLVDRGWKIFVKPLNMGYFQGHAVNWPEDIDFHVGGVWLAHYYQIIGFIGYQNVFIFLSWVYPPKEMSVDKCEYPINWRLHCKQLILSYVIAINIPLTIPVYTHWSTSKIPVRVHWNSTISDLCWWNGFYIYAMSLKKHVKLWWMCLLMMLGGNYTLTLWCLLMMLGGNYTLTLW